MIHEWTRDAKQALHLIRQILLSKADYTQVIANAPTEDLVALGQRLWWIIKNANLVIEQIKTRLRIEAAAIGPGTQRIESHDGTHCMVHPETPSIEIRKDADLAAMQIALGGRAERYFEVVTTYKPRKDFREQVAAAPPDDQTLLLNLVTLNPRQPRVVFKD